MYVGIARQLEHTRLPYGLQCKRPLCTHTAKGGLYAIAQEGALAVREQSNGSRERQHTNINIRSHTSFEVATCIGTVARCNFSKTCMCVCHSRLTIGSFGERGRVCDLDAKSSITNFSSKRKRTFRTLQRSSRRVRARYQRDS